MLAGWLLDDSNKSQGVEKETELSLDVHQSNTLKKHFPPPLVPLSPFPPLREACHIHFILMADGKGRDTRLRALLYISLI